MAVDLEKLFIDSVLLVGHIHIHESDEQKLSNILVRYQKGWPQRPIHMLGLYTEGRMRNHVVLQLSSRKRERTRIQFELEAHKVPMKERMRKTTRQRQEDELKDIDRILNTMSNIEVETKLHLHINWEFPPDSRKAIISLPLLSMSNPELPFSEIVGVRLKKAVEDEYSSTILELGPDRSLHCMTEFPFNEKISSDVIERVVKQGTKLLSSLVVEPGGKNHGDKAR